jgi:Tol biopolymer transport system component
MGRRLGLVATIAFAAACGATAQKNNSDMSGSGVDFAGQVTDDMGTGDMRRARDLALVDPDLSTPPTDDMNVTPTDDMTGAARDMTGAPDLAGVDLAVACTQVAIWPQNRLQGFFWKAANNSLQVAGASIGDQSAPGPYKTLSVEYYGTPANFPVPSTGTLSSTTTYGNCTHCVTISECASDNPASCEPKFLAQAGTVNVTAATAMSKGQFTATATGLRLYEWDFANDAPVVPGRCYEVASATFSTPFNTPKSLLWFFGDFLTNNTDQLGQLDFYQPGGAYLNFPAATAWDVDKDGLSVALGTNVDVAGRFDLWTVDYDGNNAKKIAEMAGTTGKVTAVQFSPDAKKLAFIGDLTTAGVFDVYVVDLTAATPTPVKVTPARPGGTATDYQPALLSWSRGSKYLAFTADFQTNNEDSLYIVDTTAATPTAVVAVSSTDIAAPGTSGSHTGVLSNLAWTDADQLLFKANLTSGANGYRLYRVDANGMNRVVLAKDAGDNEYEVGAFGLSPDGTTVAFSAITTGSTYEVFKMPASGASAPVNLFKSNGASYSAPTGRKPSFLSPIWWSPDGNRIAFTADYGATSGKFEPYTVAAAGGAPVRVAAMTNTSAGWIAWAPDSSTIAFTAPQRVAGNIEVFRLVDATTPDQSSTLVISVVANGDFSTNGPQLNPPVRWTY